MREAGIRGEERLKKKLQELRLPIPYTILYDVQLADGDWKVQIDCLLITDRVCIILEAKNISGHLYFIEDTDQFYRINEKGERKDFSNPHFQVLKHIRFMEYWFLKHNVPMPVTGAAFLTAKHSSIVSKPPTYRVFKLETAIERINEMITFFSNHLLSPTDVSDLSDTLLRIQQNFILSPLCEVYDIPSSDIETGVICPSCGQLPMDWNRTWICQFCKALCNNAHLSTLEEYFSLIKSTITNKEFRNFCHVKSIYAASRILNNGFLHAHENKKKRYYTLRQSK